MTDPQTLIETRWRRPLTMSEEAELQTWRLAHPEAQTDWELEAALTRSLADLPNVRVSTNFSARVLHEITRPSAPARFWQWRWSWRSLAPKAAMLIVVACGLGILISRQQAMAHRMELAQSVATVSKVASLPSPEILEDFEVIRRLNFNPPPDEELIALMK